MKTQPHVGLPPRFFNSWQYAKLEKLCGKRLAEKCALTLWGMYQHAHFHLTDGDVEQDFAMDLARAANNRDKRRILNAMVGACLLEAAESGYRILDYTKYNQNKKKVEAARSTRDGQAGAAFRERMAHRVPPMPKLAQEPPTPAEPPPFLAVRLAQERALEQGGVEQNQALAPIATASLPNIRERSEPHTAEKEATVVSPQPSNVLAFASSEKHLKKAAAQGPLRFNTPDLRPPQPVPRSQNSAQRVTVEHRKPSSAAVMGNLALKEPPMLAPAAREIIQAAAQVWAQPLPPADVRTIVQLAYTWDEIHEALNFLRERKNGPKPPGPAVLKMELASRRAAQREKPALKVAQRVTHPQADPNKMRDMRNAKKAAINAVLTKALYHHWCNDTEREYLDPMMDMPSNHIVALYAEMRLENPETSWKTVGEAVAKGRRPTRLGLLPEPSDPEVAKKAKEKYEKMYNRIIDNSRMTG